MAERTNAEWTEALSSQGPSQQEALADLTAYLRRTALSCIRRRLAGAGGVAADEMESLAEDLAQEAALLVLQRLDTFRGEAKFLTWACAFAVNLAITSLRRRMWRDLSLDRLPDGWQAPPSTVDASGWANPQLAAQRSAIWEVIADVVQTQLTPRQREVLNMIVIHGVPTEQVEAHLRMTPSALYKMTHDARRKLKAGLLQRGYSTEEILGAFAAQG